MTNSAILAIRIVGDAADAANAFNKTKDGAAAMQAGLEKASIAAGVALAAIGAAAWNAAMMASEAEQAVGAVESVFQSSSAEVLKYADAAAQAVGLSSQSYNQLASILGAQLKNMGVAGDDLAGESNQLIELGADLAATFGGTTADAVGALSSLLRGERDPIERYGVSIKAADIQARLAADGLTDLEGEAARMAETQATLALLTEQTSVAQGQFGRETDTAAGQMQIANAEWDNAVAKLGESLLPLLVTGAGLLSDFSGWVSENSDSVLLWGGIIGGAAIAILTVNGALKAYRAAQGLATAAQWAFNIAMNANPIGLVVTGLGLLVAGIITVGDNWDNVFGAIIDWIKGALGWLGDLIDMVAGLVGGGPKRSFNISANKAITEAPAARGGVGQTINNEYIIQGAIDVDGVARTIKDVQDKHNGRTGRGEPKF